MPRRIVQNGVRISVKDFKASAPKKKAARRTRKMSNRDFITLIQDTDTLRKEQRWDEFRPKNFVGLYCILHEFVYGVSAEEIRDSFAPAVGCATNLLRKDFNGNNEDMIEFMRWSWEREKREFERRSDDNSFRVTWRYQFGRKLVADFRVAQNKAAMRRMRSESEKTNG